MAIRTTLEIQRNGRVPDAVRGVLGRLPDEQRELLVLLGYYHLSRDEIGALLGQPVARIDALFRAAVRNLRQLLGGTARPALA